ncbi:mechanosensitive ion channel domain-containing protein [Stenotrophomonas sp. PS02298]|uniref:mechanosensitive ion channel family protein n=1 Tax=Stenotrophomonas sp. PS02298 TaxID=2991424 RepID=UPI002499D008|nr:mechanosensitive ion channel domain-containing protein [Stenotrophomonas sp. PS02298]
MLWLRAVVFCFASVCCHVAHAQATHPLDPDTTAAPAAPTASTPEPVDTALIVTRADTDERLAISAIELAGQPDPIIALAPALEDITRSVDLRRQALSPAQLRRVPIMRLESLDRHWQFDSKRFTRWRDALQIATAPYAEDAAELAQRRASWQATRQQPSSIPPLLLSRIDALITRLTEAEQALAGPLSRQMELSARANAMEVRLQSGHAAVTDAISYLDHQLLQVDSPPLWRIDTDSPDQRAAASDALSSGLQIELEFSRAYQSEHRHTQILFHTIQVLLLPLLLWARRYGRRANVNNSIDAATQRVLARPWSTWLLLSTVAMLVLEPDAPLLTLQAGMLFALVPVLRLLPPASKHLLGHWPLVASLLYLLAGLGFFFLSSNTAFRVYTLALTLVAMVLTGFVQWRAYRAGHARTTGRTGQLLRAAAWGAQVLFAVSLLANILGNRTLAEMLTSAIIDSAYFGLLLYVGIAVLLSLLHLLLSRPSLARYRLTRDHAPPLLSLLARVGVFAAVVGWIIYAMDSFRILRPTYAVLGKVLSHEFSFGEFSLSLGHVLAFIAAITIAFWAARVTRLLLQDILQHGTSVSRGIGNSIASLASYAVLMLGVVIALSAAGFKGSQLALLFGALGVGIGFGLQNVVNNFVSGLILMFERPIQPGDVVEVGPINGRVRDIGMRSTRIKTFDGADVVVPNGPLLSEPLVNWTLLDRNRRMEVNVGVAYGSDPQQVLGLLSRCAGQTPGVATEPAVVALFVGFGASSLDFSVRAWTRDYDHWLNIRSELITRIHAALQESGIDIPYPQQDVHVRSLPKAAMDASTEPPPSVA